MRRVLAIHLRSLSIDLAQRRRRRAARRPGAPKTSCILLARPSHGRTLVAARCNEAARRGVRIGLSLAEAQALIDPRVRARHGDPWVEELSEERDLRALHALGQWLMARFSPLIALDPPDGLFVDVAGTERLFGDEEDLCRAVLRAMHRLEIGSRLAVADTVGAASAVARFGRTPRQIVPGGDEAVALGPLPVAALRLPEATCDALSELGVESIQELLRLDRDRVAARFGGDVAMRLDQALGRAFESVTPLAFESPPQAERVFEGPVQQVEAIAQVAEELVTELSDELERARQGVLEATLVLEPSDLPPRRLPLSLSRPSADPRHLWTMLRPAVESVHLGFGIERIRFVAVRTGRLPTRQVGAWEQPEPPSSPTSQPLDRHVGELVDILAARLGPESVLAARAEPSHLPERSYSWIRPQEHRSRGASKPRHMPRPSLLFSPPEPATLEGSGGPGSRPARLRWRGIAYRIRKARGPERLARPWWDDSPAWPDGSPHTVRDYYRLETSCGRSLWAFREPKHGRTFVQGEWT
jgi:protein ImuB